MRFEFHMDGWLPGLMLAATVLAACAPSSNGPLNGQDIGGGAAGGGGAGATTGAAGGSSTGTGTSSGSSGSTGAPGAAAVSGVFGFSPAIAFADPPRYAGTNPASVILHLGTRPRAGGNCGLTGQTAQGAAQELDIDYESPASQNVDLSRALVPQSYPASFSDGGYFATVAYFDDDAGVSASSSAGFVTLDSFDFDGSGFVTAVHGSVNVTLALGDGGTGQETASFAAPVCN